MVVKYENCTFSPNQIHHKSLHPENDFFKKNSWKREKMWVFSFTARESKLCFYEKLIFVFTRKLSHFPQFVPMNIGENAAKYFLLPLLFQSSHFKGISL